MGSTKELWLRCTKCDHKWLAVALPLPMSTVAKVLKAHNACPQCYAKKPAICKTEEQPTRGAS